MKTKNPILKALVQNYEFVLEKQGKLPTINYVYPEFTADGLTEEFRFSPKLCKDLRERAHIVTDALADKLVAYTKSQEILDAVNSIAPRLEVAGKGSAIYPYQPLLFIGVKDERFDAFIVKPVVDYSMAWFELTADERQKVQGALVQKAQEKPYRSLLQRVFGH